MNYIHNSWQEVLAAEFEKPYFQELATFLTKERQEKTIYPPQKEVFQALELTPYEKVKVVILGQDPYHGENQGHGLAFSVKPGVKIPPSLRNIYQELATDLAIPPAKEGTLTSWAKQGVLLLNTVLTVEKGQANSHQKKGWEIFTDEIIRQLNKRPEPVIFVLWGNPAQKKKTMIDTSRHVIIASSHPSPLSAYRGFFGSRPFSKINATLENWGETPIDWQIPTENQKL